MINVDFADVRTVMSEMGMAMMGSDQARGDDRASLAAEGAINSPLLENVDLEGASGILVNITAGMDLTLGEFSEVGNIIEKYASSDATIVVGTVIDTELVDDLKVTVVATGFEKKQQNLEVVAENAPVEKPQKKHFEADLDKIELPTVLRRQQQEALLDGKADTEPKLKKGTDDMFDIPTFLRRQNE